MQWFADAYCSLCIYSILYWVKYSMFSNYKIRAQYPQWKKSLLDIYTYIDAFWPNTIVKGNGLMVLSCSVMWETRSIICLKLAAAAGWLQQPGRQTVVFPRVAMASWQSWLGPTPPPPFLKTVATKSRLLLRSAPEWIQIHQHHQPHFTNSIIWNRSRHLLIY